MIDTARVAYAIDEHFDAMLFEGMSLEQARWVEAQRDEAHQKLLRGIIDQGFLKVGQA